MKNLYFRSVLLEPQKPVRGGAKLALTFALERNPALPTALEIAPRRFTFVEYWILNLHMQQLEVRRDPSGEDYLETRKYKVG